MSHRPLNRTLFALLLTLAPGRAAWADIAYSVEIDTRGLEDKALSETLKDTSQLVALKDRLPPSAAALRRRADDDLPRLKDVMQAAGYWTAQLTDVIDFKATPAKVTVVIEPGPLFHLASVTFRTPSGEAPPLLERLGPAAFGLELGGPARSAPVAAAERRIVEEYARNARPFAAVPDRKAVVDVAKDTMTVTYTVDPGPAARFGPLTIDGLKRVDRDFVENRVAWHEGEPYDSRAVETTRQNLVKTNLFSEVRIAHAEKPEPDGMVPMTLTLVEGPPRSVGVGVAYNTNLGFGGQAFWEHRNLFGGGEDLRISAGVAQRQVGTALAFRKPDFVDRDQTFLANAEILREVTDAFRSRRADAFTGIERPLLPSLTADAGISIERADVAEQFRSENYLLLGAPFVLRRDTTDNLLDPTIGSRQTLTLTPYHSLTGPDLNFVTTRIDARDYERLDDSGRMILASFVAVGSIVGTSRDTLPADKRFYAGGAGSVRGYGFQRAGPLGPGDVPLGGISSLELGTELRYRITDTIGVVPFVEGGNVYPRSLPNSVKLFFGGGVGLRYYTIIGPVRLDLATPFERRPGDSPIQVYISIGQAF